MVPDYYAMLGVDPGADRAAIEAALARCQPAWSSGTRNPKTKHTYQSYLDQIPGLRQSLLGDPSSRAAYDAELAAVRRAEHDRKLGALQKLLHLRAAKGGLTVVDRQMLRAEAVGLGLTAAELDRMAEGVPPLPSLPGVNGDDAVEPPGDVLDPVVRRQIRVALDHLRKGDLYEALGVTRDAPAREIAVRADAERQRWMKKAQVTAEKTAWLEVVTLAQSHLSTAASRSRYDRTLALESEEAFEQSLTFTLKGLDRLDAGTKSALEEEAESQGIDPERADRLIARACRRLGVARDGASPVLRAFEAAFAGDGPPRLLRCRSCAGVTDFARVARMTGPVACRHCGASLHWSCPVCHKTHWVDRPKCPCGFRVELREPLVRHFEAAQRAFRQRDYAAAVGHLKRVQEFAPNHVGARKGLEKVREKVAAIDRAKSDFEIDRAAGRLVAARAAAQAWGALVDPASLEWRGAYTRITLDVREAKGLAARARRLERKDPRAARALYRKSLALASDLDDARVGLERCPPDPPANLSADYADGRVLLRWSPPPPDGYGPVSFAVLRKPETLPVHASDGTLVGESDRPEFVDDGVAPGTSVAYAVVSRRAGVESVGAVAVGPIFLVGEVRQVRVETRSREVDLSWVPPNGAVEVRVVRKRGGAPTGPGDGDRVESLIDQSHDGGLEPDRIYHYAIYAVYRTPDGRLTASRGVFLSAQPHTPVRPPEAPEMSLGDDGRLTLRWPEPPRGIVKIIRTSRPFPFPPGSRLSPVQVANQEGDWVEVTARDEAVDTPPPFGVCYYTPLTAWGGFATVGPSAVYSTLADPSDLRAARAGGGQVYLRWRWGPHAEQSVVVARAGAPPTGPDDPEALVETVDESVYARDGRYTLTLPPGESRPWHLAVYALTTVEGRPVTSPGQDPTARTVVAGVGSEINVSYQFRRGRLSGRVWSVTFRTDPPGGTVPPTVVVTNPRAVPFAADDGTVAAELPAARDGETLPLPSRVNVRRARARVFLDPRLAPEERPPVVFNHPETGAARV